MAKNKTKDDTDKLAELKTVVQTALVGLGITGDQASHYVNAIAEGIRQHFGGQQIYICKNTGLELSQRDEAICQEFNGRNIDTLCRKYQISEQWLYKIIKNYRKKTQADLFGDEDEEEGA